MTRWDIQTLNSSPLSDKLVINEKIKAAFSDVYWSYLNVNGGLIQFWAPVLHNNNYKRLLLSTFDQPYFVADDSLDSCRFHECRSLSVNYHYSILNDDDDYDNDPMIICNGSVRTAFLNHFAAVRPAWSGNCLVFPVFDYSPQTKNSLFSSCVGVVECFIKGSSSLVQLFVALKTALQIVGLSTFQECHTVPGLTCAVDEMKNALRIVCASHDLPFGQLWIPYETQSNHYHESETQRSKQINVLKLIGYYDDDDGDYMSSIKEYYNSCDMFPLRIGEGIVGKALETYEPFFCSNIRELRLHDYWRLASLNIEWSCLAVSLMTTNNVVFAFEFLWPTSRKHILLLESILLTLEACLPNFKLASGGQLGDELRVLDVENSTGTGLGFFNIFEKNRSSQIPLRSAIDRRFKDYSIVQYWRENASMADARNNNAVSKFLATFWTQLHCTATKFFPHIHVFWSQIERPQSNSSSDDDVPAHDREIREKIKSSFCNLYSSSLNGLIQFWAPVKTTYGRWILSTFDQPFALEHVDSRGIHKYRSSCMKYHYCINKDVNDANNNNEVEVEHDDDDPMIISGGAPAYAFVNRLPEVVINLRGVDEGMDPLMCCALECELTCFLMLPVFYHPSDQSSSCVGVVECSMKQAGVLQVFGELKRALESIRGSRCPTGEIEEALEIVYESHDLTLAQVWIPYDNENPMQSSSSLDGTQTKRKFAIKVVGYFDDSDVDLVSSVKEYSDTCDTFPLKTGVGLTGKTLETCEPHFCRNIKELSSDNGILALLSFANIEYSSFVICLRSGDVDYAFEFLWPQTHYYLIVLESILLTLKRCLPSFKFASGAKLGDELRVIDVDNPAGSGIGLFKTCEGNKLSSLEVKCKTNPIPLRHKSNVTGKRKLNDSCENQEDNTESSNHSVSGNSVTFLGNGKVVIKAEYGDHRTLLYLPSSSKLVDIKQNIDEKFKLSRGSYTLEYFVKSDWRTLYNNEDWDTCIITWRILGSPAIRLRVLLRRLNRYFCPAFF
ncbi:hypothetical protein Tco_0380932 [Tanacetum coccineum]